MLKPVTILLIDREIWPSDNPRSHAGYYLNTIHPNKGKTDPKTIANNILILDNGSSKIRHVKK